MPAVWDKSSQTFHGGQDWKFLDNFVEDFSVTTNGMGTPTAALAAAKAAVDTIHHYPPADFQPAKDHLAAFIWPELWKEHASCLLLGNGASELIDLVIRSVQQGGWRPGASLTQYKEYERSATADGRPTLAPTDASAKLTCIVNPTNPTGDYLTIDQMKHYIESTCTDDDHTVIVDESMQPWVGPHWRQDSLLHQREWISDLSARRGINVWVMTSWTKIWSCTGIRLGSVVAPTPALAHAIKAKQVPWSVNSMALAFLSSVVKDQAYLEHTWAKTPVWRQALVASLARAFPTWRVYGESFLSWIWIDTGDEAVATRACALAKAAGTPIRSGAPGYNLPTYIRVAVRSAENTQVLLTALSALE